MSRTALILDPVSPVLAEKLEAAGFRVLDRSADGPSEAEYAESDAWIVRSRTKITADLMAKGKTLRVIGRAGAGTDNIDKDAAAERAVDVLTVPGGNEVAVAELALAFVFALARKFGSGLQSTREGVWAKSKLMGFEITGETLGVIGLGRIGRQLAERGDALGMKVLGFDPYLPADATPPAGTQIVSMDELLSSSRFVSVHVPLSEETRGLLGTDQLRSMRKDAFVINCSRGGIVDESALVRALDDGEIAGAALDVFVGEPELPKALVSHPSILAMPHIGGSTVQAQEKIAARLGDSLVEFLSKA